MKNMHNISQRIKLQAKIFLSCILIFAFSTQLFAQENIAVTISNQNLGLVKEQRTLNLKKGKQRIFLEDIPAQINTASIFVESDFDILEQDFEYDLFSVDKLLQNSLSKEIVIEHAQQGRIEGVLLSATAMHVVIKNQDGLIQIIPLNNEQKISLKNFSMQDAQLLVRPALSWNVNASKSGSFDTKISYLTNGLNWNADYSGILNEKEDKITLSAWVTINNSSGKSFKNMKLKLMAGDLNLVHQAQPYPRQMETFALAKSAAPDFAERAFFEYHIYDLSFSTDLKNNQTKQLRLFNETTADISKTYRVDSYNPEKTAVIISFKNSRENNLGVPLPGGTMRMYKKDGPDSEFIGESSINHTPKDEKLDVEVGSAFDIASERAVVKVSRPDNRSERRTVEYKIRNRMESTISLEIDEHYQNNSEVNVHTANGNLLLQKNGLLRYEVKIKPGQEYIFNIEYAVRW